MSSIPLPSRSLVALACLILTALLVSPQACSRAESAERPNLLIITVDDMSADSLGVFGCKLPDTSPNIDAFARESLRFTHAHVQVGNCMPGRNIMWSGLFSHVNGVEGFVPNKNADYPVLCDLASQAGYFTGIRGKVSHSTPYHPYAWDAVLDSSGDGKKFHVKDAEGYAASTREGIAMADEAGKPFCLLINISDPHKPFYAQGRRGESIPDPHVPSRVFTAEEVPVPGFLPSDEVIRKELAHYYSSVRRADDCFGQIMEALQRSGQAENTFVMFLSDHGMPLPFAKTQLYHHSTHTPLMVRWPGVTEPGTVDQHHMVSAVDFVPTLMDVMDHEHPQPHRLHGRSFAPLFHGRSQEGRDHVILQYNENSGRNRHPMRGIHTREFLYLYNPWSDGSRKFATATTGTQTYGQMVKRAASEPSIAARLDLFDHRVLEELYDVRNDPDCLVNLIDHPDHKATRDRLRNQLTAALVKIEDPVAPLVASIDDASLRQAYMAAEDARKQKAQEAKSKRQKRTGAAAKGLRDVISLRLPISVQKGRIFTVTVSHRIPESLGTQKIHVTLKRASTDPDANINDRIHREVVSAVGTGDVEIDFQIPQTTDVQNVRIAAFIGADFESNLLHLNSAPIRVK